MHRQALATQLTIEPPVPLVDRAALLLQDLRERAHRATAEEVQVRSRLLVEQVQRLARLTARELARQRSSRSGDVPDGDRRPRATSGRSPGVEGRAFRLPHRLRGAVAAEHASRPAARRKSGGGGGPGEPSPRRPDVVRMGKGRPLDQHRPQSNRRSQPYCVLGGARGAGSASPPLAHAEPLPGPPDPRRRAGARGRGPRVQRAEPSADPTQDGCSLARPRAGCWRSRLTEHEPTLSSRAWASPRASPDLGAGPSRASSLNLEQVMTSSVEAGLAAVVHRFGPPEVIQIERVGTPPPGPGQVRLRVQAAGVGSWDAQVRSGIGPTPQSLPLVLGGDLAGVVESVGPRVAAVGVGDVVFGVTNTQLTGACAELALAEVARICVRPTMLTSIEAAAVPVAACTALQIIELAGISAGMRTLVLGADGNVGRVDDAARTATRRRGGRGDAGSRGGRGGSARSTPDAHLSSGAGSAVRRGARHGGRRDGRVVAPSAPTGRAAGLLGAGH